MQNTSEKLGGLECQVVTNEAFESSQDLVCVICHGFGAPGTDLVPIGVELMLAMDMSDVGIQFVFPAAPISLDPTGMYDSRAWWPIDMELLQRAVETGEFRDLRSEEPEELPECREKIEQIIAAKKSEFSIESRQIVVGGFSQGAMLATDVALRHDELLGGLIIWSGTLLCEKKWRELAAKRGKLKVVQSHGHMDPLLPFQAAKWLDDLFTESGFDNQFIRFNNVHTIPPEAIVGAAQMLKRIVVENRQTTT